jgi:hypothetical protein
MRGMDIAIAFGQGAGLAAACGLAALLPLGVLAVAALLGWTPGSLPLVAETPFLIGAWVAGAIEAGGRALLPVQVRIALSALGGAAACELATGDLVPFAGLALGTVVGAGSAWGATRLVDGAVAGGAPRWGVAAIVGLAAIVAAALAIVPFAGYALVLIAVWLLLRTRRGDRERYAGLRVLR